MNIVDCIIIGGGPAGMEAANRLTDQGFQVLLFEKEPELGGKLRQWDKLFPDFTLAQDILKMLNDNIASNKLEIKTGNTIRELRQSTDEGNSKEWEVIDGNGESHRARTVLITTGFDFFDATRKEEYGYGIYPNVITSVELEEQLKNGKIEIASNSKNDPNIAFIQCVGSRDEKVGNHYCSRNCCICAVKQAIEVKELLPQSEVTCYYMDLRMFGQSYEELYRKAQQEFRVNFIRGRVSEISPTLENRVILKAEDTLLSRPIRATVDLVVLMVGMEPSETTAQLSKSLNMSDPYGYIASKNSYTADNETQHKGLFVAGTAKRQLAIPDVIRDADAAAFTIAKHLKNGK
ncbi:FAD-dependent oxidoreductase [Bacteroidales bacterium OttesenSCG-928-B11]|nr:FAD-dependent oxidoreductase [Bacteroidales bacterium OttesenSCG-928-C03]MDL2311598.1 FAD-dependent oxidoreductase [Bacteroidales bacterium OttesenSCG-928-B11]MDL2326717.1 FAD-dependent oxidoreductase [Bacteroidales bacterium OttesenSCG-928-A14]